MGKIAVILTDPFDDREFMGPIEALKAGGFELIDVRLGQGPKVKGKKRRTPIHMERKINPVSVEDFEGLVIPRRYTLEELKKAKDVIQFVEGFVERGKPIWVMPDNS